MYPIMLDLRDRPCLLVGAGPIAHRKLLSLLAEGARVTVVAPTAIEAVTQLAADGTIALPGVDLKGPASTWTYLVNDDPFRNQIGAMLTGPGRASIAVYAAMFVMPLLIAWGLVDTFFRRRPQRRPVA